MLMKGRTAIEGFSFASIVSECSAQLLDRACHGVVTDDDVTPDTLLNFRPGDQLTCSFRQINQQAHHLRLKLNRFLTARYPICRRIDKPILYTKLMRFGIGQVLKCLAQAGTVVTCGLGFVDSVVVTL
jgi:hypothetical protein